MKLPYGYILVNGEIIVHEEKADVVRSNIFPLLVWKHILMLSSSGSIGAMWIMTRLDIPEGRPDINLPPLK